MQTFRVRRKNESGSESPRRTFYPEKERQASPMNEIIDAQNFQNFGGSQSNILN
jgi:hypothetical protein